MPGPSGECCEKCYYYEGEMCIEETLYGFCQRFPPDRLAEDAEEYASIPVTVFDDNWCGEFKALPPAGSGSVFTAEQEALLNSPIGVLDIPVRVRHALYRARLRDPKRYGSETVRDMMNLGYIGLFALQGIGKTSIECVRRELANRGLDLPEQSGEFKEKPNA